MPAVGIDLGTSRARLAVVSEDGAVPVELGDEAGMPAVVTVAAGRVHAGAAALRLAESHAETTFWGGRRLLLSAGLQVGGRRVAAEQLVGAIVTFVLGHAARSLGAAPTAAVFAVPCWFGPAERDGLVRAAGRAGLTVLGTVCDPATVALRLAVGQATEGMARRVAVVDAGAGGTSAALFAISHRAVDVLGEAGDACAGGDDVDTALGALALEQLAGQVALVPSDPVTLRRLRELCEQAKREQCEGEGDSTTVPVDFVPSLDPAAGAPCLTLGRGDVESAASGVLDRIDACCREALGRACLPASGIDALFLTGGMVRVPAVRARIEQLFGRRAARWREPEGACAAGAALLAGALAGELPLIELRGPPAEQAPAAPAAAPDVPDTPASVTLPPASSALPPSSMVASADAPDTSAPLPSSSALDLVHELRSGSIRNPTDVLGIARMPLSGSLGPAELDPAALPVLLVRVLRRRSVTGTLSVWQGAAQEDQKIEVRVVQGAAYLGKGERAALARACAWPEGRYTFDGAAPLVRNRPKGSLVRMAVEGIRAMCRAFTPDELEKALTDKLDLAPVVRQDRTKKVAQLGLDAREHRLVEFNLGGHESAAHIAAHGGAGKQTAYQLLIVLVLFDCIQWQPVVARRAKTLPEELEEMAVKLERANYFDVLAVHWSVRPREIDAQYEKLKRELAPGGKWDGAAPEACRRMRARIEVAYAVLRDSRRRVDYRNEVYPDMDFEALDDLLAKRASALEMKHHYDEARDAQEVRGELPVSQRSSAAPAPASGRPAGPSAGPPTSRSPGSSRPGGGGQKP
ncbi:MAG: Hsp70 family protein [Deltaproteobacteria bacterium]|nr:Hsp70 family protein [Deltaproteobacteria bacterium]